MPSAHPNSDKSPSPPPPAPTPLAPGPRAEALLTLYNSALSSTLSSITYSSFSACFPTIAQKNETALKAMHAGMIARLREFAVGEFDEIITERRVVERVNGLEGVISEARRRKARGEEREQGQEQEPPIAPHTLPPSPLLHSHTLPLHIAQNSQLNARLQTAQSQNASLIEDIRRQREVIEELLQLVEREARDVETAGGRLGERVGGLSDGARGAGEVLGAFGR